MEDADIYQIAKNCRTNVEMIEKYYAGPRSTSCGPRKTREARKRSRALRLYRKLRMMVEPMCKIG